MVGAADHFGLVSRLQDKVFGLGKVVRSLFFFGASRRAKIGANDKEGSLSAIPSSGPFFFFFRRNDWPSDGSDLEYHPDSTPTKANKSVASAENFPLDDGCLMLLKVVLKSEGWCGSPDSLRGGVLGCYTCRLIQICSKTNNMYLWEIERLIGRGGRDWHGEIYDAARPFAIIL